MACLRIGKIEKVLAFLGETEVVRLNAAYFRYSFVTWNTMSVTKRRKDSFWTNCL